MPNVACLLEVCAMSEVKIALIGNPNCGKTTMFNELTGSNQYVGNWPGVTVEKKEGKLKGHSEVIVTDLPGIYSLSPYTMEEVVSRNYILEDKVGAVLNLVDASNIERNLYLTTQVVEMGLPVVIALNMMDIVREKGDKINVAKLAEAFDLEMVECSALKGEGIQQAAEKALAKAQAKGAAPKYVTFAADIEKALADIKKIVVAKLPEKAQRWTLIKLFERDKEINKALGLSGAELIAIDDIVSKVEKAYDDDAEAIITNARYEHITEIVGKTVVKAKVEETVSDKIDKIVTNRFFALPIFFAVMFLMYYIAIETIGTGMTDFVNETVFEETIQPWVQEHMEAAECEDWLISLVVDGIIGGIAAPLGFAPQMAVVFLLLAFLEDCGYMSRVAFIMDRIFRQFGMSGKSFIPLLISSGCGVPALMASRTIENEQDRRITLMTTTFVPCSAKLPVIALMAGAIMGEDWFMAPIMYFIGFFSVIVCAIILKKSELFEASKAPFVMELPPYHMPTLFNLFIHTWDRIKHFLIKAGTIIFLCCLVMWALATFGIGEEGIGMVDTEESFLAIMGTAIAPIFAPLGFNSWEAVAAAISGFVAKESIVSTVAILAGLGEEVAEDDAGLWKATMNFFPNASAAFAFLVFNLMDSPCFAAISTMSKEMNSPKWTALTILFQNGYAYCLSLMIYQFAVFAWTDQGFTFWTGVACAIAVAFLYLLFRPAKKAEEKAIKAVEVIA